MFSSCSSLTNAGLRTPCPTSETGPLHGKVIPRVDGDVQGAARSVDGYRRRHQSQTNGSACRRAGRRSGCLRFPGAPLPDENEDFLRTRGHGQLHVDAIGKQLVILQGRTQFEQVVAGPRLVFGFEEDAVGISHADAREFQLPSAGGYRPTD